MEGVTGKLLHDFKFSCLAVIRAIHENRLGHFPGSFHYLRRGLHRLSAREWAAAHPREPYVLFLLNRPPPHAMLNASPFVVVVGEELGEEL